MIREITASCCSQTRVPRFNTMDLFFDTVSGYSLVPKTPKIGHWRHLWPATAWWRFLVFFQLVQRFFTALSPQAEILAVWEGFKAVSRLEFRNGGRKIANKLAVYIDNLQGQRLIASIMKETDGSSLLESLAINHPRIRQYVRSIKEEVSKYTSVTFSWTRSHTTSNSFIALGNKEADKLAKQGLAVALDND